VTVFSWPARAEWLRSVGFSQARLADFVVDAISPDGARNS